MVTHDKQTIKRQWNSMPEYDRRYLRTAYQRYCALLSEERDDFQAASFDQWLLKRGILKQSEIH